MSKPKAVLGAALALALSAALAWPLDASGGALPQAQPVVVTTPSAGLFELPLIVAMQRGYFREEGLDVSRVQMTPPVSVAALLSGEASYSITIDAAVAARIGSDAPIKLIVGYATRPLHVLMVNDPAIQSVADLRGRSLGVSALTGSSFNLARMVLQSRGLEPQTDVALQPLGASANRLAALISGQVPAVILEIPYVPEAERNGGRQLVNLSDLAELPIGGLVTTETVLRERVPQVEAMVRASLRGTRLILEDRPATVAAIMQHLSLSREVAEMSYDLAVGSFARDGVISDRGLQTMIDAAVSASGRGQGTTPAQIADFSFARRVAP